MASENPNDPANYLALVKSTSTRWHNGSGAIGFRFATTIPSYYALVSVGGVNAVALGGGVFAPPGSYVGLSYAQQTAARQAIAAWNSVANVALYETQAADVVIGSTKFNASYFYGFAYFPSDLYRSDVDGDVWINNEVPALATPTTDNLGAWVLLHEIGHAIGLTHPFDEGMAVLPTPLDNARYTVMSYTAHPSQAGFDDATRVNPITPMLYDVQAVQSLYGANYTTRAGNTTYFGPAVAGTSAAFDLADRGRVIMTIWDGGGIDWISAANQSQGSRIDLRPGSFSSIGSLDNNIAIGFLHNGDTRALIENAVGGVGNDTITGNQASNQLYGGAGNDNIAGGDHNDRLYGGAGDDIVLGEAGADYLYGGSGGDWLDGGTGIDFACYNDAAYGNLVIRLDNAALNSGAAAIGDHYVSIECVIVGSGDDVIVGDAGANFLLGGAGRDTLSGGDGNDNLYGGLGADRLVGGTGFDYARYDEANYGALTIELDSPALNSGGAAAGDTYSSIEGVIGGASADYIYGSSSANRLRGNGGRDKLSGKAGNDSLYGGEGADTLIGGEGFDYACYDDTTGSQVIFLANRALNTGTAAAGDVYESIEGVIAGQGNDRITGDANGNVLRGGGGADTLNGGGGADTLSGGDGNDVINGGDGNDFLVGGFGLDVLTGGFGVDRFAFSVLHSRAAYADRIQDMRAGIDKITLLAASFSALGATITAGEFRIGSAAAEADDRLIYNSATGAILFDRDGTGAAAAMFIANVAPSLTLTFTDFELKATFGAA